MDDTSIDIVKSAKKWVKWDDISKDLPPYLNIVVSDIKKVMRDHSLISDMKKALDQSLIKDFCIMELIIMPKVRDLFYKTDERSRLPRDGLEKAYAGVVADIVKLYNNSDDLEKMLETQTQLLDFEKDIIREDWKNRHSIEETSYEKNKKLFGEEYFKAVLLERDRIREVWRNEHSIETKGDDKNLVVEDYLKAKFTELGYYKARIEEIAAQISKVCKFKRKIESVNSWLHGHGIIRQNGSADEIMEQQELVKRMMAEDNSCSSTQASFPGQAPSDLHDENKERVQSMMAKDNSCSSTQTKNWRASCEDTIVASSEVNIVASSADDICKLKKRKMDEC